MRKPKLWSLLAFFLGGLAIPFFSIGQVKAADEISVTVDYQTDSYAATVRSPQITGTVSDPQAEITVIVNGQTYTAVNNGDNTWTLPAGTVSDLPNGLYDVSVQAVNNIVDPPTSGQDATTDELQVNVEVLVAMSVYGSGPIDSSNQSSYHFEGTGNPNAIIDYEISDEQAGTVSGSTAVDEAGYFTLDADLSGLSDGNIQAVFVLDDGMGNTDTKTLDLVKDTSGPAVPIVTSDLDIPISQAGSFILTGTTDPNSNLHWVIGGLDGEGASDENGNFSIPVDLSSLAGGTYSIVIYTSDQNGVQGGTFTGEVTIVQAIIPISVTDSGVVSSANQIAYNFTGTTDPDLTVDYSISDGQGGLLTGQVVADGAGNFSLDIDLSSLADGNLTAIFSIDNGLGDTGSQTLNITKDTVGPEAPVITSALTITVDEAGNYVLTGTTEPFASIHWVIDALEGDVTADENGDFSTTIDLSSLTSGVYQIALYPTDQYGNVGESFIGSFTIAEAILNITAAGSGPINSNNQGSYSFTGTTEPGLVVDYTISDGQGGVVSGQATADENGNFSFSVDLSGLADGEIIAEFTVSDGLGGSGSTTLTLSKDTVVPEAPTINFDSPVSLNQSKTFTFSGTTEPFATVNYVINTVSLSGLLEAAEPITGTVQADENGNFTVTIDLSSLGIGEYELLVTVTDEAGNTSPESIGLINITANPVVLAPTVNFPSLTLTQNVIGTLFTGSTEPGNIIRYTITDSQGKQLSGTLTPDEKGNFSLTNVDISSLVNGAIVVSVLAVDPEGNESPAVTQTLQRNIATASTATSTQTITTTTLLATTTSGILPEAGAGAQMPILLLLSIMIRFLVSGYRLQRQAV